MVFARPGDVFHQLAPIAAVNLGAAFAGGTDEGDGETLVIGHGHDRSLTIARVALQADLLGVHGFVGFKIIQDAAGAPGPGTQRTPIAGSAPRPRGAITHANRARPSDQRIDFGMGTDSSSVPLPVVELEWHPKRFLYRVNADDSTSSSPPAFIRLFPSPRERT